MTDPIKDSYADGWDMRGTAFKVWLDHFRRQAGDLDDHMVIGLRIAEAALEATSEVRGTP